MPLWLNKPGFCSEGFFMRFVFGAGRPVGFFALTLEASKVLDESLACLARLIHCGFRLLACAFWPRRACTGVDSPQLDEGGADAVAGSC